MSEQNESAGTSDGVTITISHDDLRLMRSALEEFLDCFSHDQGDVLIRIRSLLNRLPDGTPKSTGQPPFQRLTL